MISAKKRSVSIFVDKACPQNWIVRDTDGEFWLVPPVENAWDQRMPYEPTASTDLEPVPGHYIYMLGLARSLVAATADIEAGFN